MCFLKKFKDVIFSFGGIVVITILLLILVTVFEKLNIHVAGSREMWIGLIGALLGGAYTLIGVKLTLTHQEKSDNEKQRLENMPIIKVQVSYDTLNNYNCKYGIFTLNNDEIYTTGFPNDADKAYPFITISLANDKPAFDVCIETCITAKLKTEAKQTEAYFPEKNRLVANEILKPMFWIQDYKDYSSSNVLGVLRIGYSDLFGNKYFQDIPFSYDESVEQEYMFEIFDLKKPTLVKDSSPLTTVAQEEFSRFKKTN